MSEIPPRPDALHPASDGASPAPGDAPPRATWSVGEAVIAYLLGLLASTVAVAPVVAGRDPESLAPDLQVGVGIVVALVTLATLVLWLRIRHPGAGAALGLRAVRPIRDLRDGFLFGLLLYPAVAFVVASLVQIAIRLLTGREATAPEQIPDGLTRIGVTVVLVAGVLVAPIAEEVFFRGILYGAIAARYGFGRAALGSALLFGLVHFMRGPWTDALLLMTVMVPTGLALAWIRARKGSLYASIGAHMAFNVIGVVLIFSLR